MKLKKYLSVILIILFFICIPVHAATSERVINGEFTSSISGWGTATDSGGGSTVTYDSGKAKIRASSSSTYPSAELTQTVDFTNVYTFSFDYYATTWYTSIGKFRAYIGSTLIYETTSPYTSAHTVTVNPHDLGITGNQQIIFWVSGNTGDSMTVYVDDVSALATVTAPSITSISANGDTSGDTGETPFPVTFTADVALGYPEASYTWTISPSTGWAYTSGNSHSFSPTVTFTAVDSYDVTLTLVNDAQPDGIPFSEPDFVTVTGVTYDLTVYIEDENEVPINQTATVILTQSGYSINSTTTTSGTAIFPNLAPATYAVSVQVTGYSDKYTYVTISTADVTTTITMSDSTTGGSSGVQYAPHNVKIIVLDGSNVIQGVTVTATVTESSGPLDWLTDWMGIDPDIQIDSTVLQGTTDSNGAINFQMIQSLKYSIVLYKESDPAVSYNAEIYPTDDEYPFNINPWASFWPNIFGSDEDNDETFENSVFITLSKGQISSTQGYINFTYLDNTSQTQSVVINLLDGNQTSLLQSTQYSSNFTYQIIVHDNRGQNYYVTANITHSEFGQKFKKYGITFPPAPISFGIPEELLPLAGMALIIFTAFFIPVTGVPIGMWVITFEAWLFFLMGWFAEIAANAPGGDAALWGALVIISFLSFVVHLSEAKK